MSFQSWVETLSTQQTSGTLQGTYTTGISVINHQAQYTIPPGFFYIGRQLEIEAFGAISNIVTTPGSLGFQVRVGPTANIIALNAGSISFSATAHTLVPFWFRALLTCRSVGDGVLTTLMGQATVISQAFVVGSSADINGSFGALLSPTSTPVVGTGFDNTVANLLDFYAAFSISNVGNAIRVEQYNVKSLN
jgi:hypothetical protein